LPSNDRARQLLTAISQCGIMAVDFCERGCVRALAVSTRSTRACQHTGAWALALSLWLHAGVRAEPALVAPAPGVPQQSARHTHAHADRVILVPTAETHPEGTLFLSSYEVIVPSVGYAFTDRLHASVTGLTDFDSVFFELNVKANLLRSPVLRVAALSSIDYARGDYDGELLFGRAGATAQLCFELACRTSLSLSAMLVVHDELDTILPMGFGSGFTAQVSEDLWALLEYSALINAAREFEFIDLPLYLVGYGLRIAPAPSWALDVSLLRELESDDELRVGDLGLFELLGIPFLAFTFRFGL
jgi:hypothetical protein